MNWLSLDQLLSSHTHLRPTITKLSEGQTKISLLLQAQSFLTFPLGWWVWRMSLHTWRQFIRSLQVQLECLAFDCYINKCLRTCNLGRVSSGCSRDTVTYCQRPTPSQLSYLVVGLNLHSDKRVLTLSLMVITSLSYS